MARMSSLTRRYIRSAAAAVAFVPLAWTCNAVSAYLWYTYHPEQDTVIAMTSPYW